MADAAAPDNLTAYVTGDIHGCYKELLELEQKIHQHANQRNLKPIIVSVGDLVDRGSQCLDVVRHFREGVQKGTHAAVAGNHEAYFFEIIESANPDLFSQIATSIDESAYPLYLMSAKIKYQNGSARHTMTFEDYTKRARESWLVQGGLDTLKSFSMEALDTVKVESLPLEDLLFLFRLPLLWEDSQTVVTHALASFSECEYARQVQSTGVFNPFSSMHIDKLEGITWNRRAPKEAIDAHRVHVSGHTPLQDANFVPATRMVQVDTACVYGNKLSVWCSATREFLSTPSYAKRN